MDGSQGYSWRVFIGTAAFLFAIAKIGLGSALADGWPQVLAAAKREGKVVLYGPSGAGSVAVVKDPPHPNALKVYLDWLLGKEGQLAMNRALSQVSLRQDVPADYIDTALVPQPGVRYITDYKEAYHKKKTTEVADFVTAEIGKLGK